MTIFGSILLGVISSLVASIVFVVLLFRLKPVIEISPLIAREEIDGQKYYTFKIVNRSKRALIDVRADAVLAERVNVVGGAIYRTHGIALRKSFMFQVGPYDPNDQDADYALRFATTDDLDSKWSHDRDIIRLRIVATDHFSGFSQAFKQEFRTKRNCIKDGSHKWGLDLDVS